MAQSREVTFVKDFRGGLNLTTNTQTLDDSESPDCVNVDFGDRGGFRLRGGFQSQAEVSLTEDAYFLGATYFSGDVVLIDDGAGNLHTWDGSTMTDESEVISDDVPDNWVRMAVFDDTAYFVNGYDTGVLKSRSWDGTTLTTLGNAFNDTGTPATGDMPLARLICTHKNHVFVADTVESGVRYPHRVRFSYLGYPEDYRTADYFDVEIGDEGNPVTGMMSFQNVLLIFKKTSVHALYGDDRDNFYLETISASSGCSGQEAMCQNSGVGYWFSTEGALMGWNGSGAVPITNKMRWWVDNGKISHSDNHHHLMWADDRVWMVLNASDSTVGHYTFVYDPSIKALTRYAESWSDMFCWKRLDDNHDPLFLPDDKTGIGSVGDIFRYSSAYKVDTYSVSATPVTQAISGYYRTAWYDADETATRKRWKRARVTVGTDGDCELVIKVFHNFDEFTAARQFNVTIDGPDTSQWDSMTWDVDSWGAGNEEIYTFARLPSGGLAYAIQYEFTTNSNAGRWWIDSIALPFRRKSIK